MVLFQSGYRDTRKLLLYKILWVTAFLPHPNSSVHRIKGIAINSLCVKYSTPLELAMLFSVVNNPMSVLMELCKLPKVIYE